MNKKYIIIIAFLILQNKISPTDGWLEKTKAHFSRNKKKYITGLAAIGAGLYYKDAIANVLSNYFGSQKTVRVKTYQTDDEVNEVRLFLSETGPEENRLNNQLNLSANQISGGKQDNEKKTEIDDAIEKSQQEWENIGKKTVTKRREEIWAEMQEAHNQLQASSLLHNQYKEDPYMKETKTQESIKHIGNLLDKIDEYTFAHDLLAFQRPKMKN